MKIFYAVQATGNGHISRAMELLPHLSNYGEVAVFLSGSNSSLDSALPVLLRSKGLSLFYNQSGALDLKQIAKNLSPVAIYKTAKNLPVEKYDLVINDFEAICALSCRIKNKASVHFGHQASFTSGQVPRPENKNKVGEFILKNFARSSLNIGLHFQAYDDFILPPVIKSEIWTAVPEAGDYICVYLPSYSDQETYKYLQQIAGQKFEVFSKEIKVVEQRGNCTFIPVHKERFNQSLIHCAGIITNAGFETPAEAMYLNKKLLVIPIGGQYEQKCNAAAMQHLGPTVVDKISPGFCKQIINWLQQPAPRYNKSFYLPAAAIVDQMMQQVTAKLLH
ncbi:MAG: glycosyl transferase [Sphingobacteriales bacterium]|nr:MAG: glycosyl transferase [Sphingobacteriales bacterium]